VRNEGVSYFEIDWLITIDSRTPPPPPMEIDFTDAEKELWGHH
jgi:hypothetical protein